MPLDKQNQAEIGFSPGQTLLVGLGTGVLAIGVGLLIIYYMLGAKTVEGMQAFWLLPLFGGVAAAGLTVVQAGAGIGRTLGLAGLMVGFGWFVSFIADYLMMWMMLASLTGPDPDLINEADLLWKRFLMLSIFLVLLGAALGLLFGGTKKARM